MFTLRIENTKGNTIELTQNESLYQVVNIEGLDPPNASIYTNPVASMDGEKFKSSKLEMRNIVITMKINGDAELNRIMLYRYFNSGKKCRIYYSNGTRNVFIEGYVETIECPLFTMNQEMQISILCTNPYFNSVETIIADISAMIGKFKFPFTIDNTGVVFSVIDPNKVTEVINDGEFATGFEIVMYATTDGINTPIIYNSDTGEYISVDVTLNRGDILRIDTNKGSKSIVKISNGEETNVVNFLQNGSTWLQLESGSNYFTYDAGSFAEMLHVEFEYRHQYEGV